MILVIPASGDDIHYCTRSLSELSFVPGCQHLKFSNRLLIELRGSAAVDGVLVRLAINHEVVVPGALTQHGRRVVAAYVCLAVDYGSGDELQQVKIVAAINGHVLNLSGSNRSTGRRSGRIYQNRFGGNINLTCNASDFKLDIEVNRPVHREFDILNGTVGEAAP